MSRDKPTIVERAYQDAETWLTDLSDRLDPGQAAQARDMLVGDVQPLWPR